MFVKASVLKNIIYSVSKNEEDIKNIISKANLSVTDLEDQDLDIDWFVGQEVWRIVEEYSGDSNIGLKVGYDTPIESTGLVGLLARNSPNISKAWEEITKFNSLFTNMISYDSKLSNNDFTITFNPSLEWEKKYPETVRQAVSQTALAICRIFNALCRQQLKAKSVSFTFPEPKNSSEYSQMFQNEIIYDAPSNSLVFDETVGNYKIVSYSSSVYLGLKQICLDQLKIEDSKSRSVESEVKNLILKRIDSGNCSLKEIAFELGYGERTLQRKLAQEGIQFKNFLNAIRMNLAKKMLENGNHNVTEVANQLGYMELSSFSKRFIQIVGQSPKQYQLSNVKTGSSKI